MDYLQPPLSIMHPDFAGVFDQLPFWSAPFGKWLLDNLPMHRDMRVLDLGCGTGFPLLELAQRLGHTAQLTGLDVWKEALARAAWKADKMGLANVELIEGDAASIPFEAGHFDLVVCNLGLNNFDDPGKVLQECHRVLKKGGSFCATTNQDGHFEEFYAVFEAVLKEEGLQGILPNLKAHTAHRGDSETIREMLEGAGFAVLKMLRDRIVLRYLDGAAFFGHFLTRVGFLPSWRALVPAEKERAVFSKMEKKLNEQADWDGELRMTVPMIYVEAIK